MDSAVPLETAGALQQIIVACMGWGGTKQLPVDLLDGHELYPYTILHQNSADPTHLTLTSKSLFQPRFLNSVL